MKKPITFKTAFVIVIMLHVLGFFGFTQLSSLRAKLSRLEWRKDILSKNYNPDEWPATSNKEKQITKHIKATSQATSQKTETKLLPTTASVFPKKSQSLPPGTNNVPVTTVPLTRLSSKATQKKPSTSKVVRTETRTFSKGKGYEEIVIDMQTIRTYFENTITLPQPTSKRQITIVPIY